MLIEIAALIAVVLVIWTFKPRAMSQASHLPCAPLEDATFPWGHEYRLFMNEIGVDHLKWAAKLGPAFRYKTALFRSDVIVLGDNLAVNHILQNAYSYTKSEAFLPLIVKTAGRGLGWAEGDEHKYLRKQVAHAFTFKAVREMVDDVVKCADNLVIRLTADLEHQTKAEPVNLTYYMSPCTLEVIARIGFGQVFDYQSPESRAINGMWREDVKRFSTFAGFIGPVLIDTFPWVAKLPFAAFQEDGDAKKIMKRIGEKLLAEPHVDVGKKDILSLLKKDSNLTNEQLIENIVTFLMAGHETTSAALGMSLYDLSRAPEKQAKLRQELEGVDIADYDALEKLPYLDSVIREGLRRHPSPKDSERIAQQDDIIPLQHPITLQTGEIVSQLHIKAGDRFIVPVTLLNRNPAVWGADGNEFNPDRWVTPGGVPPASELPRGPYGSIASFVDGPRVCIGWRVAVMELKVLLAFLIRSFEFTDAGIEVQKRFSPLMATFVNGKSGELPVCITRL